MGERLLLDTHAIIWWWFEPGCLSQLALSAIGSRDNEIFFSPVSAIEIATKVRKGQMEFGRMLAINFAEQLSEEGFHELPVQSAHAELAGSLPIDNQDPWDRLLLAQAQIERMRLISIDSQFGPYDALRLW